MSYLTDRNPYFENGEILDENGRYIMMEWEREIMKESAEVVCQNGGDILNVGFGMGIIDSYIEEYNPKTHWIIEGHPAIQRKMIEEGWLQKPHVKCIFKPWQEVIYHLPKFDGIYFDTWDESQAEFDSNIQNILKPNGIYSFFNNPAQDKEYWEVSDGYYMGKEYSRYLTHVDIDYKHMIIQTPIPEGIHYWSPETTRYHIPIITLPKENETVFEISYNLD